MLDTKQNGIATNECLQKVNGEMTYIQAWFQRGRRGDQETFLNSPKVSLRSFGRTRTRPALSSELSLRLSSRSAKTGLGNGGDEQPV